MRLSIEIMNTAIQQARYVQSGFLIPQASIYAYADGACGLWNGADAARNQTASRGAAARTTR